MLCLSLRSTQNVPRHAERRSRGASGGSKPTRWGQCKAVTSLHDSRVNATLSSPPNHWMSSQSAGLSKDDYVKKPVVPSDATIHRVPLVKATDDALREKGVGCLVKDPRDFSVENKTFEIVPWPTSGWRSLDPGTGDEAGTTEGKFDLFWENDYLFGQNHSLVTDANRYLLGWDSTDDMGPAVTIWYSDYHPDGGQLFFPENGESFVSNLAPAVGDDVRPEDFTAFHVEGGYGLYIHPGVWHNAVYISRSTGRATLFGRQGRVHARISCDWVKEHRTVLRVPLA